MTHSPGPWKAARHDGAGHIIIDGADSESVGIASVHRYERHDVAANARLIAAAPDLLAACEAAKKYLEPDLVEPGRTVFWNLVAAIAKAKGQDQ